MDLSFTHFWEQMMENPLFMLAVLLTLGVIFVNGWTDAPNAIATCVATKCMEERDAIWMAAVCNFLGVSLMSMMNATVAQTITQMVDFGADSHEAIVALSAALFAIVVWAVLAWSFGIPTSESHALIAGLTGGAVALQGGLSGVNGSEWVKVLYGLAISVFMGFGLGWGVCRMVAVVFRNIEERYSETFFRVAQIAGAASMAFMHGAQDGQKFMGVILLSLFLTNGESTGQAVMMPIWLMVLCSIIMALGTSVGGKKIIKSVGMDIVKLEKYQGFSSDIAASAVLLFCSIFGIPASTTHVKTTTIIGVGAVNRLSDINFDIVKDMVMAWILTFPGCGVIGFLMTKVFIAIF